MRTSTITRETRETKINLSLNLDGRGESKINTGSGFMDHMLTLFASHSRCDLEVSCQGDTEVDYHHTVEDIGIVLGQAFSEALGDKKGIQRYGSMLLPMDEALILAAIDLSGRSHLTYDVELPALKVGDFDTELCLEFWLAFTRASASTLHIKMLSGINTHHILEGIFKAAGRCIKAAVAYDDKFKDEIPSTKGAL